MCVCVCPHYGWWITALCRSPQKEYDVIPFENLAFYSALLCDSPTNQRFFLAGSFSFSKLCLVKCWRKHLGGVYHASDTVEKNRKIKIIDGELQWLHSPSISHLCPHDFLLENPGGFPWQVAVCKGVLWPGIWGMTRGGTFAWKRLDFVLVKSQVT